MVASIHEYLTEKSTVIYKRIFTANLFTAFGMLVAFSIQGYALFSIFFSTTSLLVSFLFIFFFVKDLKLINSFKAKQWYLAALLFQLISSLGTFALVYMMASHQIPQHEYLASIYWYLHFQYNGWFFFAIIGLFFNELSKHFVLPDSSNFIFKLLLFSCIPAYGLSVLWLELPKWLNIIIVIAAIAQWIGWLKLLMLLKEICFFKTKGLSNLVKFLLAFSLIAFTFKFALQLGSVFPSISKLAFGFRPIVIAYLHLVLLAATSVFLVAFLLMSGAIKQSKTATVALLIFVTGVFLNELALAVQGIASFSYIMVPKINTILFSIACLIFLGWLLFLFEQFRLYFIKANN
jgi:hypothetical protein